MGNKYSEEAQVKLKRFSDLLQEEITNTGKAEIDVPRVKKLMVEAQLLNADRTGGYNQQRIRYNRWAEQQDKTTLMLNWLQEVDPDEGGYRNNYEACVIVTVEQFYSDRARERFTRIKDYSASRSSEIGSMAENAMVLQLDADTKASLELIYQTSALNSKMHTMGFFRDMTAALQAEEAEAITELATRLSGANAMITAAARLGTQPKLTDILRVTEVGPAMDRLIGLPDPSNGDDE